MTKIRTAFVVLIGLVAGFAIAFYAFSETEQHKHAILEDKENCRLVGNEIEKKWVREKDSSGETNFLEGTVYSEKLNSCIMGFETYNNHGDERASVIDALTGRELWSDSCYGDKCWNGVNVRILNELEQQLYAQEGIKISELK